MTCEINSVENFIKRFFLPIKRDRGEKTSPFLSVDVVTSGYDARKREQNQSTARRAEGATPQDDVIEPLNYRTVEPSHLRISWYGLFNAFCCC